MRHGGRRCNSEMTEGVFNNHDHARGINRRHIKAHRGELPLRGQAKIFRGNLCNAPRLRRA